MTDLTVRDDGGTNGAASDVAAGFGAPRRQVVVGAVTGVAGALVAAVGGIVLAAWFLGLDAVERVGGDLPKMVANTAAGFVLAGFALWSVRPGSLRRPTRLAGRGAAVVVGLLGVVGLAEHALGRDLGIDGLLPHDPVGSPGASAGGRSSLQSALAFALVAVALLLITSRDPRRRRAARLAACATGLVGVVALAGHLYGLTYAHGATSYKPYTGMAVHTAVAAILLGTGLLFARPDEGIAATVTAETPAGLLLRRLVPAATLVPLALGGLALAGLRAGWFDTAVAFSVVAVSTIAVTTTLLIATAGAVAASERGRHGAEALLHASERRYAAAYRRELEAGARLRALDEMKTTFLHAVSHELRTPLTVIGGFSTMLEEHEADVPPETIREWGRRIGYNSRRLQRLLADLLDLDRFGRGLLQARRHPTDVGELVRIVLADLEVGAHPLIVDADVGTVIVDAAQVERIVENLVINAVRHTPPDTPIWIRAEKDDDGGLLVAVDDAGGGVPDEVKGEIFEPFRQGGHEAAPKGTGIGLSLVRGFAELHGGRAWVQDRPGGGASFRVLLPPWAGRGRRVLVVDWDGKCHLCEDTPEGVDLEQCAGPGLPPILDHCPLIAEGVCNQARTAEAIVMSLSPAADAAAAQLEIARAYRSSYPEVPLILEVPTAEVGRYAGFDGCRAVAAPVTAAHLDEVLGAPSPRRVTPTADH